MYATHLHTCQRIGYYPVLLKNEAATANSIRTTITNLASSLDRFEDAQSKAITLVFSGRGDEGDQIVLQDESSVSLEETIKPLVANQKASATPKLFFIDAARGPMELSLEGSTEPSSCPPPGCHISQALTGLYNYRIDYATIDHEVAYASWGESRWLPTVARLIHDQRDESLQNIMAMAAKDVFLDGAYKRHQQPSILDELHTGPLYLFPHKD